MIMNDQKFHARDSKTWLITRRVTLPISQKIIHDALILLCRSTHIGDQENVSTFLKQQIHHFNVSIHGGIMKRAEAFL